MTKIEDGGERRGPCTFVELEELHEQVASLKAEVERLRKTLLDDFAGQALAGLLACEHTTKALWAKEDELDKPSWEMVSSLSYAYAQAMLNERKKLMEKK